MFIKKTPQIIFKLMIDEDVSSLGVARPASRANVHLQPDSPCRLLMVVTCCCWY